MNLKPLAQLFSLREIRNGILGSVVVIGGIVLATLTFFASQWDARLAGILAAVSIVFVLLIIIFIVPPLARSAGREASQMNLPFEFTGGGAVMLGLLVIVGFSAWNTGNNLLFLVLSFLTAAMVVGFFAGSISLKKLDVKMRFPETIFVGQETPILVSLQNRKRFFGSYSAIVDVRGSQRERSIVADELFEIFPRFIAERLAQPPVVRRTLDHFVFVPRKVTVEHKTTHIFDRRGRFIIRDFEISSRFPFGFFRHRRRLPAREAELYVFPAIQPFNETLEALQLEAGRITANTRGLGQDLLALRDYQPYDDFRRIDWKATARSRNLTVREFSADDDKRLVVFFDNRMPAESGPIMSLREKIEAEQSGRTIVASERFEKGISLVTSILAHFTEEQAEICLLIGHDDGEFGVGSRHLHHMLQRLAVVEPIFSAKSEPETLMTRILSESDGVYYFVVSAEGGVRWPSERPQQLKLIRF